MCANGALALRASRERKRNNRKLQFTSLKHLQDQECLNGKLTIRREFEWETEEAFHFVGTYRAYWLKQNKTNIAILIEPLKVMALMIGNKSISKYIIKRAWINNKSFCFENSSNSAFYLKITFEMHVRSVRKYFQTRPKALCCLLYESCPTKPT